MDLLELEESEKPEGLCALCVFWTDCKELGICQIDKHEISGVEQRTVRLPHKQEVMGSNPISATN